MLLTVSTTHGPATDLGYLLAKHPDRHQTFSLNVGTAHVFYPQASAERCTMALLVDVDPIAQVRSDARSVTDYVSDRPYVASSLLSVAMGRVLGTAMAGRCKERPELAASALDLELGVAALPVQGGRRTLQELFEPLGYELAAEQHPLPVAPAAAASRLWTLTLRHRELTLSQALRQLAVLIAVCDGGVHHYVTGDDIDKLLRRGEGWLETHPARERITRAVLGSRAGMARAALAQLDEQSSPPASDLDAPPLADRDADNAEQQIEQSADDKPIGAQRRDAVTEALLASGARRVLDLGCGEGAQLQQLIAHRQFTELVGVDVAERSLRIAARRLRIDQLPPERVRLMHGSLVYPDERLAGFDAAVVVEVIEHIDPERLDAFAQALFGVAAPGTVILTTPNAEYNATWESLSAGAMRHADHRFEFDRAQLAAWCEQVGERFGYQVTITQIGSVLEDRGGASQLATFTRQA